MHTPASRPALPALSDKRRHLPVTCPQGITVPGMFCRKAKQVGYWTPRRCEAGPRPHQRCALLWEVEKVLDAVFRHCAEPYRPPRIRHSHVCICCYHACWLHISRPILLRRDTPIVGAVASVAFQREPAGGVVGQPHHDGGYAIQIVAATDYTLA